MDDLERSVRLPPALRPLFPHLPVPPDAGDSGGDGVLPEGTLVWPDPAFPQRQVTSGPALWISDEPTSAQAWSAWRARHPATGLWPVLLDDATQPWEAGQVAPEPAQDVDAFDAGAFMAEVWADHVAAVVAAGGDDVVEELAPFGRSCPGLAEPGAFMADPAAVADWYAGRLLVSGAAQLGLVAARRSADVPAVMGWQGAVNHNEWTAPLSAVLRSWEDRFGVRLVRLGFDTLEVSVAAPPVTRRHALHVAAEHWAFCPDSIGQGPGDLPGYAEQILGRNSWSFWWD